MKSPAPSSKAPAEFAPGVSVNPVNMAFLITTGKVVNLSGYCAAMVFRSKKQEFIAFTAFSGAHGLIYLLMKSEDYALLTGSVTTFGAIALTMFVTRHLDWHGGREVNRAAEPA